MRLIDDDEGDDDGMDEWCTITHFGIGNRPGMQSNGLRWTAGEH